MSIAKNFKQIRSEVPDYVTIVAAAKTRTADEVIELINAGIKDIGYNYVQEAEDIYHNLREKAKELRWHMIGGLQKNKINKALPIFDVIQTVDSVKNANDINLRAGAINKKIAVLIEINIGNELSKSGITPDYALVEKLAINISSMKYLKLEGLMTIGPFGIDPEKLRPYFRKVKNIYDKLKQLQLENVDLTTISMGMSDSYKVAIEEGSNMIRPGTILFGKRSYF